MDQQKWHEWRANGIGASDAPVIMGVSPWKKERELWEEKVFGKQVQKETAAMKRGKELEPFAVEFFMKKTGIFLDEQKCVKHPEKEWMRATLDGINEAEKVLVEIKSCKNLHEEVPKHYYPQLQHQMAVVGYDKMFYLSFNGEDGKILEVEKDEKYIQELIKKEEEFWKSVVEKIEPEPLYLDMDGDINWREISERYIKVKELMKGLREEEDFLKSQFILFADGKAAKGYGVSCKKSPGRDFVDRDRILKECGIDINLYKKRGKPYWKYLICKKNT